jgi:hypothetical protein
MCAEHSSEVHYDQICLTQQMVLIFPRQWPVRYRRTYRTAGNSASTSGNVAASRLQSETPAATAPADMDNL